MPGAGKRKEKTGGICKALRKRPKRLKKSKWRKRRQLGEKVRERTDRTCSLSGCFREEVGRSEVSGLGGW